MWTVCRLVEESKQFYNQAKEAYEEKESFLALFAYLEESCKLQVTARSAMRRAAGAAAPPSPRAVSVRGLEAAEAAEAASSHAAARPERTSTRRSGARELPLSGRAWLLCASGGSPLLQR